MEDIKLIKRCKQGEKEAFQELISKYHPYVYKFLVKISGDPDVSEDLTQEVFIKIIRSIDKFDTNGKAKFSTYIISVTKNCYIDYYRKNKKSFTNVSIEENQLEDGRYMEDTIINGIYGESVIDTLEELPEEQKIAIRMKYLEGLTLKEIGEKLELEPKTVKSRIHNGIVKLRKILQGGN